ncbi:MAG TPA: hypothetical protein PLD48_02190 [Bacillota bacterium]|nr:hypothetical protein [Bacillota bacterium]HOK68151.1 hypothetical protein [Bacillota bacterium]
MARLVTYASTCNKFGGLDQSCRMSDNMALSPDMANFRVTDNYSLKKRGGIRKICTASAPIDGLWAGYIGGVFFLLYVSGGDLYKYDSVTKSGVPIGFVDYGRAAMFEFDGKVYILNGNRYSRFDGLSVTTVEGYVPLIYINCTPAGAGIAYEKPNLLTPKRRQRFSADGVSDDYVLAEKNISLIHYVTVNGAPYSNFTYNTTTGVVHFYTTPPAGINNIEICYSKNNLDRTRITKNRYAMLFGGNVDTRLFLWGHPNYPNYRFHSELADGVPSVEYFPENNFTVIGNTEITDIISQYDRQLIFTKDKAFYSYCELRQDLMGNYYSSFPVYNLNSEKGNLIKGSSCVINNEPVTFCSDGLNRWCSTTVENEKNAVCFSAPIAEAVAGIVRSNNFSDLRLFDFQNNSELIFYHNGKAYIYNYKLGVWYLFKDMFCDFFCVVSGELCFSFGNNIYKLDESQTDDEDGAVTAYWKSPFVSAGESGRRKDVTELSLTVGTKSSTMLDVALNSDIMPENAFTQTFVIENAAGIKTSCLSMRPNLRRVSKVQIHLRATGRNTDAEIFEITLTSKPKGSYARYGL